MRLPTGWTDGLSPCVRGHPRPHVGKCAVPGSIPVCTGSPRRLRRSNTASTVYPRVYGVTVPGLSTSIDSIGLSPCVRGHRIRKGAPLCNRGSIPVCTGSPDPQSKTEIYTQVYPRVYGVTGYFTLDTQLVHGLSPCVRGHRSPRRATLPVRRSIPVCTGSPPEPPPSGSCGTVYPRVYGVTKNWLT